MRSLFLILSLVIAAQSFSMASKPAPKPVPPVERPPEVKPEPHEGLIRFSPVKGYTAKELEVLAVSEALANELVKSKCFAGFMEKRSLIQTNGKTAAQVVEHIKNAQLTIPLVMYYQNNGVVGYRQPPDKTIYTNRKFHAGATACSRASNLTHEASHVLGYGHDFNASRSRPRSVPYSINGAVAECCSCKGVTDCKLKD